MIYSCSKHYGHRNSDQVVLHVSGDGPPEAQSQIPWQGAQRDSRSDNVGSLRTLQTKKSSSAEDRHELDHVSGRRVLPIRDRSLPTLPEVVEDLRAENLL